MFDDRTRLARIRNEQDRAVREYIRRQVYPYSAFNRARLDAVGLGPARLRRRTDLLALPPVSWSEVGDGTSLVLRPDPDTITRHGEPGLALRFAWAKVFRRQGALNRKVLDPLYRPIHWVQQHVYVGYTAPDFDLLSEIGRRWLEAAGIRMSDVIVSVIPAGPNLDFWQLMLGARRGGVSAFFAERILPPDQLQELKPSVLAGRPNDLVRTLRAVSDAGADLDALHTVLATGEPLDATTRRVLATEAGRNVVVLSAWSPPGVRAMWAECRGGQGLHTWPAAELVDVVDPVTIQPLADGRDGDVVWSPLRWSGSVVLRLRTGVRAALDSSRCPACGRMTPRLMIASASTSSFGQVLDAHPGVAAWQGELRSRNGGTELVVFLSTTRPGHPGRLVRDLDRRIRAAQFVVLDRDDLEDRLEDHDYARIVDLREQRDAVS